MEQKQTRKKVNGKHTNTTSETKNEKYINTVERRT